jgi:L-ascorbate metabolism protein UlaG (beta-lactamase superfamily)
MLDFNDVKFYWLGHDGFRIVGGGKTVYTDPYQLSKSQQNRKDADIILISHNHFDHLSMDDIKQVVNDKTTIVAARECSNQLKSLDVEVKLVAPGDKLTVQGMPVEVVRAYNTNKTFHPKADNKVGYVFTLNNLRIYHAADTDDIPEMAEVHPDIALVPVSGTYVMTAEEAARAINDKIKPRMLAIPMHYASIVGSEKDAARFKDLVNVCPVQIIARE